MKTKILTFVFFTLFTSILIAQEKEKQITYPNGGVRYAHPMKKSKNPKPKIQINFHHECISIPHGNIPPEPAEQGYNPNIKKPIEPMPCKQTIYKGKNFEANNLAERTPADNNMAISNNGRIVSVDNYSIMEFDESGNEISNTEWQYFFTNPFLTYNRFFDPKVIYDSNTDRFILVVLYLNQDFSDSRVLISFSNTIGTNALTWNQYDIRTTEFFTNPSNSKYWFDYPNIAINKEELFVTLNVFRRTNGHNYRHKPLVLQIDKSEGYNNMYDLPYNPYTEIFTGDGNYAYNLLPLSDGLQSDSYQDEMYFVNNYSSGSSDMWWRKLTGNIQGNSQINTPHYFTSPVFYNVASYASQMGGNASDRIKIIDNRIKSGFYKDSKLHFVFHSSDNGWMQIVYEIVDIDNNSVVAHTYGGYEDRTNYLYPSIACLYSSIDNSDKVIVNFNRTSPNMYVQVAAIDYQNNHWGCLSVIKKGEGILNLKNYDGTPNSYEPLGHYTCIQKKYNSNKAWLVGSYPFGTGPNDNGAHNGLNAWISEVSFGNNILNQSNYNTIYPNPNSQNGVLHFNFTDWKNEKQIIIKDMQGIEVLNKKTNNNAVNIPNLKKGIYFIEIKSKNNNYEKRKLIIN